MNKYIYLFKLGYCEYEERIIIDLEKSEKEILDLALLKGNLYLLFNDQYVVISQENTEYFESVDSFQQLISFKIQDENKLAFLGKNKINFEGIEYQFENSQILDFKDAINNSISKNFLLRANQTLNYVSFDFQTCELNKIIDFSQLDFCEDIKSVFEIESYQRMFFLVNKKNELFLIAKLNYYNYMLIQVNKKVDYIKLYEQYSTLLNTKLQRKKAKCVYKQQDKQTENIFESDTNLEAKISYEDQQELEQLNQREKYNQIQTNVQILQGEKNQIENQRNQIEDLNNSYDSDEVVLDINTQQLIQFVKECDNQNKNWANQTNQREDEQISGSNKYQKIQDTLHKFQQIKNSKQVIVDILKEGIHHSQLQYSKYLYNGKQVNKQQEACQICKQPICESTEENSKHQQQQKNKLEGKIFFILCKHSFHKHCILLSPNYSQNFKYNQCPICANYQFLQDLPASSFF